MAHKSLDQLENFEQKWAYFFKHAEHSTPDEIKRLIGKDIIMQRAFEAINRASWTEEELRIYEQVAKTLLDNQVIEEQKLADAEAKGKAEGIAEGKVAVAKNMLASGMALADIINVTGLTQQQLENLK